MTTSLIVKPLGKNKYEFRASGCPLDYFLIWEEGKEPEKHYVQPNENNIYRYTKNNLENINGIYFEAYDSKGNLKGEYFFPPDTKKLDEIYKKNFDLQLKLEEEQLNYYHEMELERIRQQQQIEIMLMNEERKRYEDEKRRREEEETRKRNEHLTNVSSANNEINNMKANILKNYTIKINQKAIRNIYDKYKLLDINCLIPKKHLNFFIDNQVKNISGKMIKNMLLEYKHFNIIVLGKTGVGKSTLINSILKLDERNKAKEGFGLSTTQEFQEYTSNKMIGLRLIDSRGIEIGSHNINQVINSVTNHIEDIAKAGNPDKFIHCLWYCICIASNSSRVEREEEEAIKELKDIYEEKQLPIIFVLTKSYNEEEYSKMVNYLMNLGIIDIIPVLSKNYKIVLKDQNINIPPKNLKTLIKLSFDKCKNSGYPSFKKSLNEQIFYNI